MTMPAFSFLAILLLCSCANFNSQTTVEIESMVDDCFTFSKVTVDTAREPVIVTASISQKNANSDCPCKSAVMQYKAFQKNNGNDVGLLSGQFSILGKENVVLPIAVQRQLIIWETPIHLSVNCANEF